MKLAILTLVALLLPACGKSHDTGGEDLDLDSYFTPEDCDDANANINPTATEVCDGVDNDCDGFADESDADGAPTWYRDSDGDLYGDDATGTVSCAAPDTTWVDRAGDCDDADAQIHPGAREDNCEDPVDYNCDGSSQFQDKDGDGVAACLQDCDDSNAAVNPDAEEVCDDTDLDENCDGRVNDESAVDAPTWYIDYDRDSYGTTAVELVQCDQPDGFVADSTDCDDADATTHPYADESCDDKDNDCDGETDEEAVGKDLFYADTDADGFGDAANSIEGCEQPDGYVVDSTDCDDTNAAIFPKATEYCNATDDDCDGEVDEYGAADAQTYYIDYDHDGYGDTAYTVRECVLPYGFADNDDDCDDLNTDTFPGADEICDLEDNDCDGSTDEEAVNTTIFYQDTDGDGYGDPDEATVSCFQDPGWVTDNTDCNDGAADVYPGATEYCGGIDHDCDGLVDEEDAADALPWFVDGDSDGYGNGDYTSVSCDLPPGYASMAGDCDDGDPAIFPAADETCNAIDDDCDDVVDEGSPADAPTWYIDADGDSYGSLAATRNVCNQPAGYVSDVTDCLDSDALVNPGAEEICNDGTDNDCDGVAGACTVESEDVELVWQGEAANDAAGFALANVGDINADGEDDVAIASYGSDRSYTDGGAVYIVNGPFNTMSGRISVGTAASAVVTAEALDDRNGYAIAGGDVSGDGIPDLVTASIRYDGTSGATTDGGAVYVVQGPITSDVSLADAETTYLAYKSYDRVGYNVALPGDVDGDGNDDLVFSAYTYDNPITSGADQAGAYYVQYGPVDTGDLSLKPSSSYTQDDNIMYGEALEDRVGTTTATPGDVNGDGMADLLIGCERDDTVGSSAGAAYVAYGPILGAGNLPDFGDKVYGVSTGDNAGNAVGSPGDYNGDGYQDLAVGARYVDPGVTDGGRAYLFAGGLTSLDGRSLSTADIQVSGVYTSEYMGTAIMGDFDFNSDGVMDLLVGATGAGTSGSGGAYLYYGPIDSDLDSNDGDAFFEGESFEDNLGRTFGFVEDAGAGPMLLLGAYTGDLGGTDAGQVYAIFNIGL